MAKQKERLQLNYQSLPDTLLLQQSSGKFEKVIIFGLVEGRIKVKLYDLLKNGYDLKRSCNKYGTLIIMQKNNKITDTITLQTY